MNGPWQAGWSGVALALIGWWRFWAGLRNVWPQVVAAGGTWLRRVWQAQDAEGEGGAGAPPEERTVTREILVIDDDKLTRWSLAKALARAG
jgi:hypothetical protein